MTSEFWNERYRQEQTGWDIGTVSTPLQTYFDQLSDRSARILIPGAGNAYEAEYLLRKGFTDVTVVDISDEVIGRLAERLQPLAGNRLTLVCEDFFAHEGRYDLIVEQTFFCALNPALREAYVRKMKALLKPAGVLAGVLFDRTFAQDGPPFGGSVAEYDRLFTAEFGSVQIEPCYNSIPPRAGAEVFILIRP
ncbi:methyltransferase [Tellurirhabdus rosea]|uniref:methyltransferase n=1 Tax=Tellurirhabdus rosea TaxID=2674997 RepID=UPI002255EBDD|nr:methyltransferase [Tellurirhabdus rosea]